MSEKKEKVEVEVEQAPQETPQGQQDNPLSAYDTTDDYAQLEGLGKELQDIEASLENNFAQIAKEAVDNDVTLEDLFHTDRLLFFKKILELQNAFAESEIMPRVEKAKQLGNDIAAKEELGSIEAAKQEFLASHPDVNLQEMLSFFLNEVPPKIQQQVRELPQNEFFNVVYELYSQAMQPQEPPQNEPPPPQDNLPAQAQGVAVSSEEANSNSGYLPMNRN